MSAAADGGRGGGSGRWPPPVACARSRDARGSEYVHMAHARAGVPCALRGQARTFVRRLQPVVDRPQTGTPGVPVCGGSTAGLDPRSSTIRPIGVPAASGRQALRHDEVRGCSARLTSQAAGAAPGVDPTTLSRPTMPHGQAAAQKKTTTWTEGRSTASPPGAQWKKKNMVRAALNPASVWPARRHQILEKVRARSPLPSAASSSSATFLFPLEVFCTFVVAPSYLFLLHRCLMNLCVLRWREGGSTASFSCCPVSPRGFPYGTCVCT